MTKDDIIRMARDSGLEQYPGWVTDGEGFQNLERFATLVAAAEREECAKVCEEEEGRIERLQDIFGESSDEPAHYLTGKAMACVRLATAIRERGKQ